MQILRAPASMVRFAAMLAALTAVGLAGCGRTGGLPGAANQAVGKSFSGNVHGGQQPVAGALIQLYAAGTAGDRSASTPLLNKVVLTDANGNFSITGDFACPAAPAYVYLTATGGNPGGTVNPNLAMMVALGTCGSLSSSTFATVNEVTTVGATMALYPYMNGYTAIGSGSSDMAALGNAFATAAEFVNTATGFAGGPSLPSGYTVDGPLIDTIADILATCINSGGGVSGSPTNCGNLFSLTGGATTTDTIAAAAYIATNPSFNLSTLFGLLPANGPFQPVYTAPPFSFAVAVYSTSRPTAAAPTFSLASSFYTSAQPVTLTSVTSGATIFYTIDGTTPNSASPVYNGPILVASSESIRATAVASGYANSALGTAAYTVGVNPVCSAAVNAPAIAISGTGFTKNGSPWVVRGLHLRGFVASLAVIQAQIDNGDDTTELMAQQAYSNPAELQQAATAWNANILRFQVSQPALDPAGTGVLYDKVTGQNVPLYDPAYLPVILAAINQARCAGFAINISMQDESRTGAATRVGLPTQATLNAWNQLMPHFANAPDVVFELYNEPAPTGGPANWQTWEDGGTYNGSAVIGMQQLMNKLRKGDATQYPVAPAAGNAMLLDGLGLAATLAGVPNLATPITDKANPAVTNQFAYAIHPYPRGISVTDTPAQYIAVWDTQFGNLSATAPVICTEWSSFAGQDGLGLNSAPTYQVSVDLLNYLVAKRIAISVGAYDIPGVTIKALDNTFTPSNFDDYADIYKSKNGTDPQNPYGENDGLLVQKLFNSPYPGTVLTCNDAIDQYGSNGATCGQRP